MWVPDRGVRAIFLMLLLAPALVATAGAAAAPRDVREVAREVLSDRSYQKKIRDQRGPSGARDRRTGGRRDGKSAPRREAPAAAPRQAGDGSVMRIVLLLGVVLIAAFAVLGVVAAIRERREQASKPGPDTVAPAAAPDGEEALGPFEELAAAGDFSEAVRVMLQLFVAQRQAASGQSIARSATGRELLRRLPRDEEERAGLKRLVAAVELSLFGGRAVTENAYQACLAAYRGLVK